MQFGQELKAELVWVRGYLDQLMELWRQHADTQNAVFDPYLDREWQHHRDGPRTLVSQCRLIYTFSRAHEWSREPGYADLARRGIMALEEYFGKSEPGAWAWACHGDGRVQDDTLNAYGHAFVILAFSTAATVFHDDGYRDQALRTWQFMQRNLRDEHGGLVWHVGPDGQVLDDDRSQNPLMHSFEALLALAPLDESGTARDGALEIWRFLQARMPSAGCLPEWFDPSWQALAMGDKAVIEIGHAYEWAYLLSDAHEIFPEEDLLTPGRQFLDYGMRHGYDAARGGVFSQADYDGKVIGQRKGWWEQCEAIRAMQRYVVRHNATDIAERLRQTIAFAREHFVDDEYGGWYLNPPAAGGVPSLDKGNEYKLDYHVVNMCRELLGL
jgi:mannose/cellobiose epimerase-like protein (N-acyl-D-glucosamine 2-epimerase family)